MVMVPFKGKLSIKVRMPDKPIKFGVKFFELYDAKTGYCKNFSIYAEKDDREIGAIGKTGKIVPDFVADLHHTNHHLCVDNFYNSPILFLLLRARGIFATGRARTRKGYPHEQLKRTALQKRGEVGMAHCKGTRNDSYEVEGQKRCLFLDHHSFFTSDTSTGSR